MPLISIIITTYKHEKFISQTIESILDQSFTDWELLIGDDSPDDNTWNIIQEYVNKYPDKIKAWHHNPNKGIVDNMNFLLEKVNPNSEYIAFLEGDDMFTHNNLEEKMKVFEEYKEVMMVYNNLDFINGDGKIFYKNFLKKAPFYLKNEKLSKEQFIKYETFYLSYSTLMIKKEILEKEKIINLTQDKLYSVSDWDLFFRVSTQYNCYGIEESLTLYRRHNMSVSRNNIKLFDDLEIQMKEYLKNGFVDKKLFDLKMSFIKILKAVSYIENNNPKDGIIALKDSFRYNYFSYIVYKFIILLLLVLPNFINKVILNNIIKRG